MHNTFQIWAIIDSRNNWLATHKYRSTLTFGQDFINEMYSTNGYGKVFNKEDLPLLATVMRHSMVLGNLGANRTWHLERLREVVQTLEYPEEDPRGFYFFSSISTPRAILTYQSLNTP